MQQGMVFNYLNAAVPGQAIEQILCQLEPDLSGDLFESAWAKLLQRHSGLRVVFNWRDTESPSQSVVTDMPVDFQHHDWSGFSVDKAEQRLDKLLQKDRQKGFDLESGPCMRFTLVRMPANDYRFVWSFHHVLIDGRSFGMLLREVFAIYDELRGAGKAELPDPLPFRDFVGWQQKLNHDKSLLFWREFLTGYRSPTVVRLAGAEDTQTDEGFGSEQLTLPAEVTGKLRALAAHHKVGLSSVLQAVWALLLARYSGSNDVVFGVTRSCPGGSAQDAESAPGIYINTLPARIDANPAQTIGTWLQSIRQQQKTITEHEQTPLVEVQRSAELPAGQGLFESIVVYDTKSLGGELREQGGDWLQRDFKLLERPSFPLALYAYGDANLRLRLNYECTHASAAGAQILLGHMESALVSICDPAVQTVGDINYLPAAEIRALHELGTGEQISVPSTNVSELIANFAQIVPDAIALADGQAQLTWCELNERANAVAARLANMGVGAETIVGLCAGRSVDLVVALLGILKTGAAYLPLDPDFPAERLAFMVADSAAKVIVTESAIRDRVANADAQYLLLDKMSDARLDSFATEQLAPEQLAYLIYTSGSTGVPKGVMVEHGNLNNFLLGMDAVVGVQESSVWLAVTSLSFDISVLELLWTLSRGNTVVIFAGETVSASAYDEVDLDFGLFYFAAGGAGNSANRYRMLLEGAKFADTHQFNSVWTPERHFHDFGGLYPNPVIAAAALATITSNIDIRAGSIVLPLHNPIRVAEDWALVDNLSNGRVGISVASGWHPNDFALAPANYPDRKQIMVESLQQVRQLWRGETIEVTNGVGQKVSVGTLPRPIQEHLPVWVTTAGNVETYLEAGRQGANILTHLLGQSVEEVAEKIQAYRKAYQQSGAPGRGQVTLMLHTFVGDDTDEIREIVRQPMVEYLRSSASLVKNFVSSWTAYRGNAESAADADGDEFSKLSKEDMDDLLNFSFERYFETSGLFGAEDRCMEMLRSVYAADIDEVACLIDFGVAEDLVLEHLEDLSQLRQQCLSGKGDVDKKRNDAPNIPELIKRYNVSHMQCTPSMARVLAADPLARGAIESLHTLLVGGEAFPADLAADLVESPIQRVINMYGPTEATIWSAVSELSAKDHTVGLGGPIANTELFILDEAGKLLPKGVPGELYIGGAGVVRGYLQQPELTSERFVTQSIGTQPIKRLYRTGDVVKWLDNGQLGFIGRSDFQVKIRGHRIELGEIEACLLRHAQVADAVVAARTDASDSEFLVAWVVASGMERPDVDTMLAHLARHLPEYMLPSSIIYMEALPLTPNRKIDRNALPDPGSVRPELAASYVPPQTELEELLADIWIALLRVDRVGRLDNYFKLGGHSLNAVQLAFRIREQIGIDIPMRAFFNNPTLKGLAATIEKLVLEQIDDDDLQQIMSDNDAS